MPAPVRPDWFFSYVDIPNLPEIRRELSALPHSKIAIDFGGSFYMVESPLWSHECPKLYNALCFLGIAHKVRYFLLKTKHDSPEIHVDSFDPVGCQISLNIPVSDYEGTYTCWFTLPEGENKFSTSKFKGYPVYLGNKAKELIRVETTRPMLINPTVPHRVDQGTSKARYVACIRFIEPLTTEECKKLGIQQPYIQTD